MTPAQILRPEIVWSDNNTCHKPERRQKYQERVKGISCPLRLRPSVKGQKGAVNN